MKERVLLHLNKSAGVLKHGCGESDVKAHQSQPNSHRGSDSFASPVPDVVQR